MTKRQLEQSPRIVSGKAPSWRFLQGAGYGGNRQPYFYSRMVMVAKSGCHQIKCFSL